MKKPKILKTAFSTYKIIRSIGEGGNGYVYEAEDDRQNVAIKVLDPSRATNEKLKRFENEYKFCSINRHKNIICVNDYGLSDEGAPFFSMPLYTGSIRKLIGTLEEDQCFSIIKGILDGVEAAHELGVVHRDLKPENILYSDEKNTVVIADFGISEFGEDELFTAVETKDGTRLANFLYAAPEQRIRNEIVDKTADIYSLGLIFNELFTEKLALGKNHKSISDVSDKYSYMDPIIDRMLEQEKSNRFQDIKSLKIELSARSNEYISSLKIAELNNIEIPTSDTNDAIINDPIKITSVEWDKGVLTIHLSNAPTREWLWALANMGGHSAVLNKGPEMFSFSGTKATIASTDDEAQRIINYFKAWLPKVASVYENKIRTDAENEEKLKIKKIQDEISREEKKKNVNASLTF